MRGEKTLGKALELRPGWEKATDGLEAARESAALEENKGSSINITSSGRIVAGGGSPLDQTVDPTVHATLLTNLHQATIDSMDAGRLLQQILEKEVEPAIKELSNSLLASGTVGGGDLDECVKKFESALQHMRAVCYHFIHVHITLSTAACLPNHQWKLVI